MKSHVRILAMKCTQSNSIDAGALINYAHMCKQLFLCDTEAVTSINIHS